MLEPPTSDSFEPPPELAERAYSPVHAFNMNGWRCGTAWDIRPHYESTRIGPIELPPPSPPPPLPKLKAVLIRSSVPVNISLELPARLAAHCFERHASSPVVVWLRTKPNGETTAFYVSSSSSNARFTDCVRRMAESVEVEQQTPVGSEIVVGFGAGP